MNITHFTFFSTINDIQPPFSYWLVVILTLIFIAIAISAIYTFRIKKYLHFITSIMFGIWFLSGILLNYINDNSFISDWINSAVAIGTIGAVITSLYLSQVSNKTKLKNEAKLALFMGIEIIVSYSTYDKLILSKLIKNDELEDKIITNKLTQYQWDINFIFNDTKTGKLLICKLKSILEKADNLAYKALKEIIDKNLNTNCIEKDFISLLNKYNTDIIKNALIYPLNKKFADEAEEFNKIKLEYMRLSKEIIDSI